MYARRLRTFVNNIFKGIVDAVLPEECAVCGKPLVDGERYVCLHCIAGLPRVKIDDFNDNPVHHTLASTIPVYRGASLFRYRRQSPYTNLILKAKYDSRPRMAQWLGQRMAHTFYPLGFFNGVDALVPVPLSLSKHIRRGYNQSREIAVGIAQVAALPVIDLLKARHHSVQAHKKARNRRSNAQGVFYISSSGLPVAIQHVVLVDDVITTGSTMLECIAVLRYAFPALKVSVMSVALTEI